MKYSLNWLKDFVDIPDSISPQELAEKLTLHAAEVEEIIDQAAQFRNIVVGEIVEIRKHPNADKLKVCIVDIGEKSQKSKSQLKSQNHSSKVKSNETVDLAQIICGGDNIYTGMRVAVALPGAKIRWHGEGDLVELEEASIRGEKSFGMICASAEIGLAESTNKQTEGPRGVMDLKDVDAEPGTVLAQALGLDDFVFDIENKSITNRPDLWGHFGLAREISAVYGLQFISQTNPKSKIQNNKQIQNPKSKTTNVILNVDIKDKDSCLRYMSVVMDRVRVSESPEWLKSRLRSIGQRPINNLVDISNYVMYELGQPVHIFDSSKLKTQNSKLKIIIRQAKKEEKIATLDGIERELEEEMLVIADSERPIAIAGVMGGENSEVDENTHSIVIEVANFDAASIRKTASTLGLRTEASARFEKSLDPAQCEHAISRVMELAGEICPDARVVSEVVDIGDWNSDIQPIELSLDFVNKRIGEVDLSVDEVRGILERLGFVVEINKSDKPDSANRPEKMNEAAGTIFYVVPPSWRSNGDVSIPEDIVEEIARIYGYNNIPPSMPRVFMESGITESFIEFEMRIKRFLASTIGLQEVHNYSFVSLDSVLPWGYVEEDLIEMENPPAFDQPYMRPTLLASVWKNAVDNARWYDDFGVFEIGRVFRKKSKPREKAEYIDRPNGRELPDQPYWLTCIFVGSDVFSRAKGAVERLGDWGRWDMSFDQQNFPDWLDPSAGLRILARGAALGYVGLITHNLTKNVRGITAVSVIDLDIEALAKVSINVLEYKKLPKYPATKRDISVIVDVSVSYADIVSILESQNGLESVQLFDIYEGDQVGAGKKSMAFHLAFRDPDRTLTDEEVEERMGKIMRELENKFAVEIRDS